MEIEEYKRKHSFAEDYGTSQYKFGPVAEKPEIVENRGLILDTSSIIYRVSGISRSVIVGPDVSMFLGSREDISRQLIYPMRDGTIDKNNERAWKIIYEITKYGLLKFRPSDPNFKGFYVAAALSAIAPKYMYEKLFEIHKEIDEETGLVKAVTIIPQPLAVAISQKTITCIVVESGHGNTQITPISRYPIRSAIISLNRGGAEANMITAEILKDSGYGDLVHEEKLVRMVKEAIGLIPRDLKESIRIAKEDKDRFRAIFRIPNTTTVIDLGDNSWMRFLIGEIIFDPESEAFESYYKRGMPRPKDTVIGDIRISGTVKLSDAIILSAQRCPLELQPHLYRKIILSGGNFAWRVPDNLKDVAVDARTRLLSMFHEKGISVSIELVNEPLYSVWRGALVYSIAVPEDYEWKWDKMEGWYKWR